MLYAVVVRLRSRSRNSFLSRARTNLIAPTRTATKPDVSVCFHIFILAPQLGHLAVIGAFDCFYEGIITYGR